jgi:hypothetical protein
MAETKTTLDLITGQVHVSIREDSTHDRRSRAAAINAAKRQYERTEGVRLILVSKSYSETHGFLSRSEFRYSVAK